MPAWQVEGGAEVFARSFDKKIMRVFGAYPNVWAYDDMSPVSGSNSVGGGSRRASSSELGITRKLPPGTARDHPCARSLRSRPRDGRGLEAPRFP
jgi:hypothetical protein